MNKTNQQSRTRDMDPKNKLTGTRGVGARDKGGKKWKGLVKEQILMTHVHGQQGGD